MRARKFVGGDVLCGLATAEAVLGRDYPALGFSRFQLRRLCMAGEIPCHAVRWGRRTHYLVRPVEVARRFADGGVFCAREGVCHG